MDQWRLDEGRIKWQMEQDKRKSDDLKFKFEESKRLEAEGIKWQMEQDQQRSDQMYFDMKEKERLKGKVEFDRFKFDLDKWKR